MILKAVGTVLLSTALASAAQLMLKQGLNAISGRVSDGTGALALLGVALQNPVVLLGILVYVLSAAMYMVGLARLDISVAFPIVGLSYAIVPAIAQVTMGEVIPTARWVGIATICLGVAIVTITAAK